MYGMYTTATFPETDWDDLVTSPNVVSAMLKDGCIRRICQQNSRNVNLLSPVNCYLSAYYKYHFFP